MFLLYHESCKPVGRALGRYLIARDIIDSFGYSPERASRHAKIVRYGHSGEVDGKHKYLNDRASMLLAQNKYKALHAMNMGGVHVPPYYLKETVHEARDCGDIEHTPYFLRKFHHTRGQDIQIVNGDHLWTRYEYDYAVQYVPTHKEYRIHAFNGKVLFAQKKVYDPDLFERVCNEAGLCNEERSRLDEEREMVRNYEHGYKFVIINDQRNIPVNVVTEALRAVKVLGLDFGAVDVSSLDEKDREGKRKAIVWEVNTAPALETDRALEFYAQAIRNHQW